MEIRYEQVSLKGQHNNDYIYFNIEYNTLLNVKSRKSIDTKAKRRPKRDGWIM